jgi:hypothetical protein
MAKIFYVDVDIIKNIDLIEADFSDKSQVSDSEFRAEARLQKNESLSTDEFETLFNDETINSYTHVIRILKY